MPSFTIFECTSPSCRLRFPLDVSSHRGTFCPRCGGELRAIPKAGQDHAASCGHAAPRRRICGILDNLRSAFNVGGIFRTADGAGLDHLYLCGITPTPSAHPTMAKTALGAESTISWSVHHNSLSLAERLQAEGIFLLALECTAGAIPIQEFSLQSLKGRSVGLVVGHERAGVDPGLMACCDAVIALPMVGRKASLNAAVAFGVAAYWLAFR